MPPLSTLVPEGVPLNGIVRAALAVQEGLDEIVCVVLDVLVCVVLCLCSMIHNECSNASNISLFACFSPQQCCLPFSSAPDATHVPNAVTLTSLETSHAAEVSSQ